MTMICTRSRQHFSFMHPEAYEFSVDEIAAVLDSVARWSGHTSTKYSVLQHSLAVCAEAEARLSDPAHTFTREERARIQLQALFHDAAEAYIGDIPTPLKKCLRFYSEAGHNEPIEALEHRILRAMSRSLFPGCNLDLVNLHPLVLAADAAVLRFEAGKLMGISSKEPWVQSLPECRASIDLEGGREAVRAFKLRTQEIRQPLIELAARGFQDVLDLGRT